MRRTITISVSEEMHDLIYKGMRSNYHSTVSEYIRSLVRRDHPVESSQKDQLFPIPQRINDVMKDVMRERQIEEERRGFSRP